jgi:hypothetical protein
MRKLALALAAAAALGLTAPSFMSEASAAQGLKVAQADVKVKVRHGRRHGHVKKVIVRHDRGLHRGWRHARHPGVTKKVIIKRGGGTVVKKKIIHRG